MKYLPINIDLKNRHCIVFGAGTVALRKIQMLLKAGAKITCIAKTIHPDIKRLNHDQYLNIVQMDIYNYLSKPHLTNITLIISATGNAKLAQHIFRMSSLNNTLINTVDNSTLSTYISPAIVNRNPIIVSISSSGAAPVLARNIRESIEKILPHNIGKLATFASGLRNKIKATITSLIARRKFWEDFFNSSISQRIIETGNYPQQQNLIDDIINKPEETGEVYLVGVGPGDPELLTIKALRVMQKADVVLHDRLISTEILEMVRRDAQMVDVGKSMGQHKVKQPEINQLLIKYANQGKRVCRLKAGDPFIYGRGGEEIQALKNARINYQIVPGITAAIGCAAYAGIPLTHRDFAQNVLFVTAHCKNSIDTLDWQSLSRGKQTLAVYMGIMKSSYLVKNLISNGKNPMTPIAVIENGTRSNQRVITGSLHNLTNLIKINHIKSPALIIIGEVTRFANKLAWFEPQTHIDPQITLLKSA